MNLKPLVFAAILLYVTLACVAAQFRSRAPPRPLAGGYAQPLTLHKGSNRRISTSTLRETSGSCVACNNSETCCDGSTCCNQGSFCCEEGNTCCQDTCCQNTNETCCHDPVNGGVCCESEWSFCCVPQPEYDLPSRCCPRWFVCCDLGEYGCCNPDTGLPLLRSSLPDNGLSTSNDATKPSTFAGPPGNAFALILEPGGWSGNMNFDVNSINVTTGATSNVSKVQNFRTGGEEQRQFMFDKKRSLFYLLQADSDNDGHNALEAPIRLFTVEPGSGATTMCTVAGAVNLVTGYHLLPESLTVVFSTYWLAPGPPPSSGSGSSSAESQSSSNGALPYKVGYKFYHLDIATCSARQVAQSVNPTTPHFVDDYAGWFHDVSPDGSVVYRLGFENVVTSTNFGLGATVLVPSTRSINGGNVGVYNTTTQWKSIPRPDGTHEAYISLNLYSTGTPTSGDATPTSFVSNPFDIWFVSMAPSNNITDASDLSLFMWSPADPFANVTKLATFPNAHQYPAMSFGPLSESLSTDGSRYVALVVQDSPLGDMFDTLSIVFVDGIKPPGGARPTIVLEAQLQPVLLAETVSPAGVGLPDN